jgi:hypothetical protein
MSRNSDVRRESDEVVDILRGSERGLVRIVDAKAHEVLGVLEVRENRLEAGTLFKFFLLEEGAGSAPPTRYRMVRDWILENQWNGKFLFLITDVSESVNLGRRLSLLKIDRCDEFSRVFDRACRIDDAGVIPAPILNVEWTRYLAREKVDERKLSVILAEDQNQNALARNDRQSIVTPISRFLSGLFDGDGGVEMRRMTRDATTVVHRRAVCCDCMGKCATIRCPCVKRELKCGRACTCDDDLCINEKKRYVR